MKSKASIKTHPIHPMLVGFPIAFFTGTLLFDLGASIYNHPSFWQTARLLNVAGVLFALLAAIPGLIDYFFTVPPSSSAKRRATMHALINITVVALFTFSLVLKYRRAMLLEILCVEVTGFILLCIAGYMGGTLVYRNQIGVYNRYADKGKWSEKWISGKTGKIEVASSEELKVNQMKLILTKEKRIVVARTDLEVVAFDDRCSHKGGSLAGGTMICGTVQCPWHGSQFSVHSGLVAAGPATDKINTYTVTEENGKIFLVL